MLKGHIDQIGQGWYIKYATTLDSEPTLRILWWKIESVARNPFRAGSPSVGDEVTRLSGQQGWTGPGYTVYLPGDQEAEKVETVAVPCPPARGKPTRWRDGRWEKLLARGWVPA